MTNNDMYNSVGKHNLIDTLTSELPLPKVRGFLFRR